MACSTLLPLAIATSSGAAATYFKERYSNIPGVIKDTLRLSSRSIIQLGLLFLIAPPITRVVLSIIGFARQRDLTYLLVTFIVLSLLVYSLLGETPG